MVPSLSRCASQDVLLETRRHAHQYEVWGAIVFTQGLSHRPRPRLCSLRGIVIRSTGTGCMAVDVNDAKETEPGA